jgi:hypothetical protein
MLDFKRQPSSICQLYLFTCGRRDAVVDTRTEPRVVLSWLLITAQVNVAFLFQSPEQFWCPLRILQASESKAAKA